MSRILTLALATGLLAAPLAAGAAQNAPKDTARTRARAHAEMPHRGMPGMGMRGPGMPIQALIAQRERLKLSDEQVTRLNAIQAKYSELNKPHLEALKAARSDTAGRPDPVRAPERREMTPEQRLQMRQEMLDRQKAFLAAHPEVSRAHTAIAENHRKAREEVQSVLTDEQEKLLEQRMERRPGMRRAVPDSARRRSVRG